MLSYWHDGVMLKYIPVQKYLQDIKSGEIDLNETVVETYLHELAHTAEMNFESDYDLHTALSYTNKAERPSIENTIKLYILGKFKMNGEMCGVPMEYWKHQNLINIQFVDAPTGYLTFCRVVVVGEDEDPDRPLWDTGIGRNVVYGSDFSVEAIPDEGFRFVRWSDGVTTAKRKDVNVIAYFRVEAIFEKIE